MAIKQIKTIANDFEMDGIRDYGGQGSIKYVHPLTTSEILKTPEFLKAIEYAKALTRIKKLFKAVVKSVPLTNRGTLIKAIQKEIEKDVYDLPVLDLRASSIDHKERGEPVIALCLEYLQVRRALASTLNSFGPQNRSKAKLGLRDE